jgi:hypothetical protein
LKNVILPLVSSIVLVASQVNPRVCSVGAAFNKASLNRAASGADFTTNRIGQQLCILNTKTPTHMNNRINKLLFSYLSDRDRRRRVQIVLVVLLSILAVSAIVVMEMHRLHHLPVRPPSLFS